MEAIIQALSNILINALPTLVLVILLHFFLKSVFFRPLERVLQQRYEATEGARKAAETSLARATEKAAAYESSIQAARLEIYREQEQHRLRRLEEQAVAVQEARLRADEMIQSARTQIAEEVSRAAKELTDDTEALATRIAGRLLGEKAA